MLADAVQGALRPAQTITWVREDGEAENLTGATITGRIVDAAGVGRAIAGTLAVVNGAEGIFTWAYAAGDVANAGAQQVQFNAAFGAPPTPARTFVAAWYVREAIL